MSSLFNAKKLEYLDRRARSLHNLGLHAEALIAWQDAIKVNRDNKSSQLHLNQALALLALHKPRDALHVAFQVGDKHPIATLRCAQSFESLGAPLRALHAYTQIHSQLSSSSSHVGDFDLVPTECPDPLSIHPNAKVTRLVSQSDPAILNSWRQQQCIRAIQKLTAQLSTCQAARALLTMALGEHDGRFDDLVPGVRTLLAEQEDTAVTSVSSRVQGLLQDESWRTRLVRWACGGMVLGEEAVLIAASTLAAPLADGSLDPPPSLPVFNLVPLLRNALIRIHSASSLLDKQSEEELVVMLNLTGVLFQLLGQVYLKLARPLAAILCLDAAIKVGVDSKRDMDAALEQCKSLPDEEEEEELSIVFCTRRAPWLLLEAMNGVVVGVGEGSDYLALVQRVLLFNEEKEEAKEASTPSSPTLVPVHLVDALGHPLDLGKEKRGAFRLCRLVHGNGSMWIATRDGTIQWRQTANAIQVHCKWARDDASTKIRIETKRIELTSKTESTIWTLERSVSPDESTWSWEEVDGPLLEDAWGRCVDAPSIVSQRRLVLSLTKSCRNDDSYWPRLFTHHAMIDLGYVDKDDGEL